MMLIEALLGTQLYLQDYNKVDYAQWQETEGRAGVWQGSKRKLGIGEETGAINLLGNTLPSNIS